MNHHAFWTEETLHDMPALVPAVSTNRRPAGACRKPECQAARAETRAAWRAKNPDYFIARRIQARGALDRAPVPLRLPAPLWRLPWDLAQDEFKVQGADFIGVMGTLILRAAQDQV